MDHGRLLLGCIPRILGIQFSVDFFECSFVDTATNDHVYNGVSTGTLSRSGLECIRVRHCSLDNNGTSEAQRVDSQRA